MKGNARKTSRFFYYGGGQIKLKKVLEYSCFKLKSIKICVLHTFTVDIFFTTKLTQIPSTTSNFVLTFLQGTLFKKVH